MNIPLAPFKGGMNSNSKIVIFLVVFCLPIKKSSLLCVLKIQLYLNHKGHGDLHKGHKVSLCALCAFLVFFVVFSSILFVSCVLRQKFFILSSLFLQCV